MLHVLQYSIVSSVQLYCNVIYSTVTGDGMALRDVVAHEAGGWLMEMRWLTTRGGGSWRWDGSWVDWLRFDGSLVEL